MALSTTNFDPLSSLAPKSPNFTLQIMYFFVHTPRSNRRTDSYAEWLKWRVSAQGRSFWGSGRWVTSYGEICPKTTQKDNKFQAKTPKLIHRNISRTISPTNKRFEDRDQTTKGTLWVVCHYPQSKYNLADGRHLENRYDVILPHWVVSFRRNSAASCRITRRLRRNGRDRNRK